jgi:hypothetical protein
MDNTSFPFVNYIHDNEEENTLSKKEEVLLHSVLGWFNEDKDRVQQFSDIVKHKNGLSLRIIDWLITNFSKNISVSIKTDGLPVDLYRDYHKNLSAHNKKNFDPFARRRRICIVLFGLEQRFSTIGQLNFFRWFISKNLRDFVIEKKSIIEKHMRESEKISKKGRKGKFNAVPVSDLVPVSNISKISNAKTKPQSFSGTFKLSFY